MRVLLRWLSNALIVGGLVLLVGTGAIYGYSLYEQAQAERAVADLQPDTPDAWTPQPTFTIAPLPSATPQPSVAETPSARATDSPPEAVLPSPVLPEVTPPDTATPTPVPAEPAIRIQAPAIHLDAKVVESPIVDGQWQIPKFAAGHLQGTAQPLQGSNVVLAGHVESISSGNVFANIGRLRRGDVIRLYTRAAVVTYRVDTVEVVANDDLQVVAPTPHEVVTLITCTGSWLPLQHDYSERTVVIASRVADSGT